MTISQLKARLLAAATKKSLVEILKAAGISIRVKDLWAANEKEDDIVEKVCRGLEANGFKKTKTPDQDEYCYTYTRGKDIVDYSARAGKGYACLKRIVYGEK